MADLGANLGRDSGEPSLGAVAPARVVFYVCEKRVLAIWAKSGL
jgi:hypothetical protein